jgi:hypothetical protein
MACADSRGLEVVDNVAGLAAAPAGVVVTLEHDLAHPLPLLRSVVPPLPSVGLCSTGLALGVPLLLELGVLGQRLFLRRPGTGWKARPQSRQTLLTPRTLAQPRRITLQAAEPPRRLVRAVPRHEGFVLASEANQLRHAIERRKDCPQRRDV